MCKNRDILHIGVVFGSTSDLYFVNHHFEDILHFIHVGRMNKNSAESVTCIVFYCIKFYSGRVLVYLDGALTTLTWPTFRLFDILVLNN